MCQFDLSKLKQRHEIYDVQPEALLNSFFVFFHSAFEDEVMVRHLVHFFFDFEEFVLDTREDVGVKGTMVKLEFEFSADEELDHAFEQINALCDTV